MPFEGKEDRSRRSPSGFGVFFACSLLASATLAASAYAQTSQPGEPDGLIALPTVVVTGNSVGTMQSAADTAGFSDVIYSEEAWQGFESVTELLEHAAGVQVSRFGGREDFATISVRGSGAGQVKIMIDGVNLSRAQNRVVNLADLPMDSVERIEIYRGFTPVEFAASGAASVVNIITKKSEQSGIRMAVGGGSFGTAKLSAAASVPMRSGQLSASVAYKRSDGDFGFASDAGTPANPADDFATNRLNNAYESIDTLVRLVRETDIGNILTLSNNLFYKDEGIPGRDQGRPGQGAPPPNSASLRVVREIAAANWQSADAAYGAGVDLTYLREVFSDPGARLGFGYQRADNRTLAATLKANGEWYASERHLIQASVETAQERFKGRTGDAGQQNHQRRTSAAIALSDEAAFFDSRLYVVPQVRLESLWNSFDGSGIPFLSAGAKLPDSRIGSVDPRIGMRWDASGAWTFKANAGTYFRAPELSEEFGDSGFSKANPELLPEQGVSADAGVQWRYRNPGAAMQRAAAEFALFANDSDDLIVFVQTAQQVSKAENVDEARVRGAESRLEMDFAHNISAAANFTVQDTENRSPQPGISGKELPALPSQEGFLSLTWRLGGTRQAAAAGLDAATGVGNWTLGYELAYKGERFFDEANRVRVPSQTVHNASVAWQPAGSRISVRLEGENLGNDRVADQLGFPVPGRSVYLTISYQGGGDDA